jgi:hypothetical protein
MFNQPPEHFRKTVEISNHSPEDLRKVAESFNQVVEISNH